MNWNIITNIFSIVTIIWTTIKTYIDANTGNINYYQLAMAIAVAVVTYLSGKNFSQGKFKKSQINVFSKITTSL